jgi:glycosyltransferase involved in cell wall biosynthesis
MLGLAMHLPESYRSVFLSFAERGLCRPFLDRLRYHGIQADPLDHNFPHLIKSVREITGQLRKLNADVLCCHGYKADLLGYWAARGAGIAVVGVSRGWTGATRRVRFYEGLDKRILRRMDAVVCVSAGQAQKVRRAGVSPDRVLVIRNAIQTERFQHPDLFYRRHLESFFAEPCRRIVVAAGRLSPEKGFGQLVEAAAMVTRKDADVGFVLFGDGPLKQELERRIHELGLAGRFILAGFHQDVDQFLPHAELVVLPSFTEGLPNVALESLAAGVPVVATAVGGTPEVVQDGISGFLVPPGNPSVLAGRIFDVLSDEPRRKMMGLRGRQYVEAHFTFEAQSAAYQRLFQQLKQKHGGPTPHIAKVHSTRDAA